MLFSIALLIVIFYVVYRAAPHERPEDAHIHGPGQVGVIAALALFGMDYFTSYYYASGELMSALHPYGLQHWGYYAAALIAICNFVFGALYMYSLGVFNEGGGSYTASMRYLAPSISLIVAVVLLQDYIFTIVVSSLSGVDQFLSVFNLYNIHWVYRFLLGAMLVTSTWWITIRGRGESARITFTLLGIMMTLTIVLAIGLFIAEGRNVPAVAAAEPVKAASLGQALFHLLTASMKGLVALSGLEAMSNGIQFVKNEDAALIRWGKKYFPKFKKLWDFYSGKSGIGRIVQTSFLFYGGLTTFLLVSFSVRFNVFDGTLGRSLVGNLAKIGFEQLPGGVILFWVYQLLAVALLAAASMTAFQDLQATEWRDVAIGEIPEIIVYRNPQGTFTRSVTAAFILVVVIQFIFRGKTSLGVPYYGIGVYMPIMMMGWSVRKHILATFKGRARTLGSLAAGFAAILAGMVFVGQIVGKWQEGGWVVLISFTTLVVLANLLLISPIGYRSPAQIHRIVREKARVRGAMGSIVEWQSLKMQGYRYTLLVAITNFFALFGIRRPMRFEAPPAAGEYDDAIHVDHPEAPSILAQYLEPQPKPINSHK